MWAERYSSADIVRQAAVLCAGISQNHAYTDGNKRTAQQVMSVFLRANGRRFTGERLEIANWLITIANRSAEGELDAAIDEFESWLRQHVQ